MPGVYTAACCPASLGAGSLADIVSRQRELDLTAAPSSPGELEKTLRADMAVNRELVKSIGLKLD